MKPSNLTYRLPAILLLLNSPVFAQPVTFSGTGNVPVPLGAPVQTSGTAQSDCVVSGIGTIGTCAHIASVDINLEHTWDGELGIFLIGPGGQVLELSTGNGGFNDDYTNTTFTDNTALFITDGAPPFTGAFRPEGRITNLSNPYSNAPALGTHTFANTYNGINGDGIWMLYINDYGGADSGVLLSWSITFDFDGPPPEADAGPDAVKCPGQNTTLSASGGGTYLWSTGATTANISVAPTITTTYTVTVSAAGCGTDTDEVMVMIAPNPGVTFMVSNPDLCQGDCQTVTANLVGTPPFSLTYKTIASNGVQTIFMHVFNSTSETFQVCPPPGTVVGNLQVLATSLTDANCTCN